jgi:hypothetical protein
MSQKIIVRAAVRSATYSAAHCAILLTLPQLPILSQFKVIFHCMFPKGQQNSLVI